MRCTLVRIVAVLASVLAVAPASAQGTPQMINIPLSSPGEPYNLDIS